MGRKFLLLVLPAIFLLAGCANTKSLKQVSEITQIRCGALQYPESGGMVFRDAESWQGFWQNYCKAITGEGKQLEAPEIDFSSQMLIGVFSGSKPTGGYGIGIQRVLEDSKKIVVEYVEKSPPPDAIVTMAFTYPCHIVSIPRSDKAVEFKAVTKD